MIGNMRKYGWLFIAVFAILYGSLVLSFRQDFLPFVIIGCGVLLFFGELMRMLWEDTE